MARNFRRVRTAHPIAELNVTNMIDLGFTLLIIFMVATPLITQEQSIKVNLPVQDKTAQAKADPTDTYEVVVLRADGSYYLGIRKVTLAQLDQEFKRFAARAKQPVIEIKADATATMQQWVSVVSVLEKYQLKRVSFPTQVSK